MTEEPRASGRKTLTCVLGFARQHGVDSGFLWTTVLLLLVVVTLPIRFEVNDDMAAIDMLRGADGFRPHPAPPFISQCLAYVLFALYRLTPSVPWYGLVVYLAAFLGVSLLLGVALRATRGNRAALLVVLPVVGFVAWRLFCFVTFSSATLLLALGVTLFLTEWVAQDGRDVRHPRLCGIALTACFALAYALRWGLAVCSVVFAAPALVNCAVQRRFPKLKYALLALVAFIAIDRVLCRMQTGTPLHRGYTEYNRLRAEFHDTVKGTYHGETTDNALKQVGWTAADYTLFRNCWMLYDERLFNTATLKSFLEKNPPPSGTGLIGRGWQRWKGSLTSSAHYTAVVAVSLLALVLLRLDRLRLAAARDRFIALPALALALLLVAYLMVYRFVPRVYLPVYLYIIGLSLFVLRAGRDAEPAPARRAWLSTLRVMVVVMIATVGLRLSWKRWREEQKGLIYSRREKDYINKCLDAVAKKWPNDILVMMNPCLATGVGCEKTNPLREHREQSRLRILPYGTSVNHPRYAAILKLLGASGGYDLLKSIADRTNIMFVLFVRSERASNETVALWESYYRRNIPTAGSVSFVPVADLRNADKLGLVFFRLRAVKQ